MRLSDAGQSFIVRWEGVELKPYRDVAGRWTVGVGHLLLPGEAIGPITTERAFAYFREDIARTEAAIRRRVKAPLNQNQFDSLCSWTFNLGEGNLAGSTLLKRLNEGRHGKAADEFERWVYARKDGKPVKVVGLVNRRRAERQLFLTPHATRG